MAYFISVLGLALVIEGIPYFAFPDGMKSLLAKLPAFPARSLRIFGIAAISAGLLFIYISQNYLR
jgi:uncharacterized protein YjeT (DUF2065 family)